MAVGYLIGGGPVQVVIQTGFVYDDAAGADAGGQDASIAGARAALATGA